MKSNTARLRGIGCQAALLCAACGLLLVFAALDVGQAQARTALEQVKTFGEENIQLRTATAAAVNTTGAGGVPPGTLYVVAERSASVASYTPQGEFREAWGWGVAESEKKEFQRCGPDGEVSHPSCAPIDDGTHAGNKEGWGLDGEGKGQMFRPIGVAVDQATGNVYVFNQERKVGVVQVFSADGAVLHGGFGEFGRRAAFPEPAESIAEGPTKFHRISPNGGALTVDDSGNVYVADEDDATVPQPRQQRVMKFEPGGGNVDNYAYATSFNTGQGAGPIASDAAGHVYVATAQFIIEYAPPSATPICKFQLLSAGIQGMTVDPESGQVYFFNGHTRRVERLKCNGAGEFVSAESIPLVPKPEFLFALAFDPATEYENGRESGILDAISPEVTLSGGREVGAGLIFAPAPAFGPAIEGQSAAEVGRETAALRATINPKGAATRYVFQFITEAAYQANPPTEPFAGAVESPVGRGNLKSGLVGVPVAVGLSGLRTGTRYHFRVVAENCTEGQEPALCTTIGPEDTFRTFPALAGAVPDGRAYELVSPPQKNAGEVWPAESLLFTPSCLECKPGRTGNRLPSFSAPDGEKVAYQGSPFSATEAALNRDTYMSTRTSAGWKTVTLNPTLGGSGEAQGVVGLDNTLSRGILKQNRPSMAPSAPSEVNNLYTLQTAEPSGLSPVLTERPPNTGEAVKLEFAGASSDFGKVIFSANDALTGETPFAPPADFQINQTNLYEYVAGENAMRLVNVLPGNSTTVVGAVFGSEGGGSSGGPEITDYSHAISADGSRVFWSSPSGQVYVREEGVRTRELSDHAGQFLTASSNGDKVLLTDGILMDLQGNEESVDLTQGLGGFLGIAGQSLDLSKIYFVDTAALTGPNSQGSSPTSGKNNLYEWDKESTRFIATLTGGRDVGGWRRAPARRTAQASPNGAWLAFVSSAPLTGQTKLGPCQFKNSPPHGFEEVACPEVFLYSAATGQLSCSSCTPTEEAPLGASQLTTLPSPVPSLEQQSYLTDAGRLFFDSPNRLSPSDANGGAEDVYEFEPNGVGTCSEAEGCVSLISGGDEYTDSNLLSIDGEGNNVFFTTREKLTPWDRDELIDLYDARVGGGIAAEYEAGPSECRGEACQGSAPPPPMATPGTPTVEGDGNVAPKPKVKKKHHRKKHQKHRQGKHQKKGANGKARKGGAK